MRLGLKENSIVKIYTSRGKTFIGRVAKSSEDEVLLVPQLLLVKYEHRTFTDEHGFTTDYTEQSLDSENEMVTVDDFIEKAVHINPNLIEEWTYANYFDLVSLYSEEKTVEKWTSIDEVKFKYGTTVNSIPKDVHASTYTGLGYCKGE